MWIMVPDTSLFWKSCEIDHLYILPDYQNKGVGSKLVFWIENYLKKLGYEALELNAYKENTKSHELYIRLGFDHLDFISCKAFSLKMIFVSSGSSSVGRASAFQAECRGFEPGLPL